MKIGTFSGAMHSLKEGFRKNGIENRIFMIFLWAQMALIVGFLLSYLVVVASTAFEARLIQAHPHQLVSIDWLPVTCAIGFLLFVIGLPVIAFILGIRGVLPGTRRKKR